MKLRDYCDDDFWLTEALESDPSVMLDLGGPTPMEKIPLLHSRRLNSVLSQTIWYFTIIPESDSGPVGTIGIWESDWKDSKINEMGWMILPAFRGRGLATTAGQMLLERARTEQKLREIHAFPSVRNGASNAICRKLSFVLNEEVEIAYNGPMQASNHWVISLGN